METPEVDSSESHRLELLYVKALFLEKRHRECIVACRKILMEREGEDARREHPLRTTFMRFYLALSHDELARAMHSLSQAKIPAFDQAADLYNEAVSTLPTAEECIAYMEGELEDETEDDFNDSFEEDDEADDQTSPLNVAPSSRHDSVRSSENAEKARPWSSMHSAPFSPPTHIRHNSVPIRSPPMSVSGATTSEFDDLESHDSFNEIMTPNRMPGRLERDYSSMSLIAPAQKQLSHSSMRPVRMSSPAKSYHLPDAAPNGFIAQHRSHLPRLDTSPTTTSPVRKQLLTRSEQASPIDGVESPVSPLGSECESFLSDFSTISPITPENHMLWRPHPPTARELELQETQRVLYHHLQSLRTQLESHQALLQSAKLKTRAVQLDHSLAQSTPRKNGAHLSPSSAIAKANLQTPYPPSSPDARTAQRHARILAGRARDWRRERFDATRYTRLAEAALAEL